MVPYNSRTGQGTARPPCRAAFYAGTMGLPFKNFSKIAVVAVVALAGCGPVSQGGGLFDSSFWEQTPFKTTSNQAELGIAEMMKGNYLTAESHFLAALEHDPKNVHALLGAGILYQNTGQNVKARQMYEAILAIRPPESQQFVVLQDVSTQPVSQLASVNLSLLDSGGVLGRMNQNTMVNAGEQPVSGALAIQPIQPAASAAMGGMAAGEDASMSMKNVDQLVSEIGFSPEDRYVVSRFTTIRALRDQGLVSPEEYKARRQANIGALLPLTSPPPSAGLDRPVPTTEQISTRLQAIGRALELKAISVSQHASERNMILDALMPAAPVVVAPPALPPEGLLQAADQVRRLEMLRDSGFITSDEYSRERAAIEASMVPEESMGMPAKPVEMATQEMTELEAPKQKQASGPQAGIHLASYKSEAQAERGWSQLRRAFGEVLGDRSHTVVRVDLGSKGVYFRLIAGPFDGNADAKAACKTLKSRQQFCEAAVADFG